jgi:hypothetical protein
MSSERQPRPFYDRFQKLMDRTDTMSIGWWAEATEACRAALVESRTWRLELSPEKKNRSLEELEELERREQNLARLARRFAELEAENRLPPS